MGWSGWEEFANLTTPCYLYEARRHLRLHQAECTAVFEPGEEGLCERSDVLLCGIPDMVAEQGIEVECSSGGCRWV